MYLSGGLGGRLVLLSVGEGEEGGAGVFAAEDAGDGEDGDEVGEGEEELWGEFCTGQLEGELEGVAGAEDEGGEG